MQRTKFGLWVFFRFVKLFGGGGGEEINSRKMAVFIVLFGRLNFFLSLSSELFEILISTSKHTTDQTNLFLQSYYLQKFLHGTNQSRNKNIRESKHPSAFKSKGGKGAKIRFRVTKNVASNFIYPRAIFVNLLTGNFAPIHLSRVGADFATSR